MKIAIIGGGPGGYIAAIRAAQLGAEVTIIEKNALGGTCLNVGCIPTKALLHSAELYYQITSEAARNGILVNGVSLDFAAMQKRKAAAVKQLVNGVGGLMAANGITVLKGAARFASPMLIEVMGENGTTEVAFDRAVIASGSVPAMPPIPGSDLPGVVDSSGALGLEEVPKSLCIIGGGVIGVEMAHVYQRLGAKITIVEMLPDILVNMDSDLTAVMKKLMKRKKIDLMLETKVESIEKSGEELAVRVTDSKGQAKTATAEKVLMCVGRRPATEGLGLSEIGVKMEKGRILVDESYRTSVENIYAAGDCTGGVMLAHTASAEGIAAVERIMGQEPRIDFATVPSCVYTSPELAGVGLSEKEAAARGIEYETGSFPLAGNGKALIEGDTSGLCKIVADKNTGEILGLHMCGPSATELIAEGALAIGKKATVEDILAVVHAHPSVGESVQEAAHAVFGNALNMPPAKK